MVMALGSLCTCIYGCKHIWVESVFIPYGLHKTTCPKCKSTYPVSEISSRVDMGIAHITKMTVLTFVNTQGHILQTSQLEKYAKRSLLLTVLEKHGFKNSRLGESYKIQFYSNGNNKKNFVIFYTEPRRSTSDMIIGLHDKNSDLIKDLMAANKEDRANAKLAPAPTPAPKPKIESMKDALGYEIKVGDWVVQWSSKSLSFGKIHDITETGNRLKERVARVRSMNQILSPIKYSSQLLLLPEDKAMLMLLEK